MSMYRGRITLRAARGLTVYQPCIVVENYLGKAIEAFATVAAGP